MALTSTISAQRACNPSSSSEHVSLLAKQNQLKQRALHLAAHFAAAD
jgi:hypothetical protein